MNMGRAVVLFFVGYLLPCLAVSKHFKIQARVHVGEKVTQNIYPFIVRIGIAHGEIRQRGTSPQGPCPDLKPPTSGVTTKGPSTCAGTVVSPRHVLSSARCLSPKATKYTIHFGSPVRGKQRSVAVEGYVRHPQCHLYGTEGRAEHDLVLFRTARPFPADVTPLPLPDPSGLPLNLTGRIVETAGWGNVDEGSDTLRHSEDLRVASLRLLDAETCQKRLNGTVLRGQICATAVRGYPQADDYGAPLLLAGEEWYLLGVFSWFLPEEYAASPFVFTGTLPYAPWIRRVVANS